MRIEIIKKINAKYPKVFENKFSSSLEIWLKKGLIDESYKYFTNPLDIEEWAYNYYQYFSNLQKEKSKLCVFTSDMSSLDALDYYAGYFYEKINGLLRYNAFEYMKESIIEQINFIELEINKFSIKENIIVIRRISNSFLRNYLLGNKKIKRGAVLFDKGFLSTSLNLNYRLNSNSDYEHLNDETLLVIKIPKGIKGVYLEALRSRKEFELLFQKSSKMIIEDNFRVLNNNIILTKIIN